LLDEVNAAKEKQEEATWRLSDAITAEATAIKNLKEAYRELASAAEAAGKTVNIPKVPAMGASPTMPSFGNGTSKDNNINIIVQSGVLNGAQVGEEIYQYLRDYERVNGPLNLMV
jgi:hypothetical protein